MVGKKRQQARHKRVWYLFLLALFLLGLTLGIHLSQRTSGAASPSPAPPSSPQPSGTAAAGPANLPEAGPDAPPENSPGAPPEDKPSAPPEDKPSAPPEDSPSAPPEDSPSAPPEDSSSAPPEDGPSAPPEDGPDASAPARETLESMTQWEKICQMFLVFPSDLTGGGTVTQAGEELRQALADYPVGGLLFNTSNMVSREQLSALLSSVQRWAGIPLILTCDEEGGRVSRLMRTVGTTKLGPMLDYAQLGPETAAANARTIAGDMAAFGFNADFAPVADVWSNPDNTVIGDRAYSRDFAQAAALIPAAVEGFHAGGVACTLKHFPGHGDTAEDSHMGTAYVKKTLEQLRQEELLPFRAGIEAGADMVMLGHLTVPETGSEPAPFSSVLVTGLLREELGFRGVVITDSLKMQAVTKHYSSAEAAVKAVQAGVDLLLCPEDLPEAVQALLDAVERGEITQARIDESVLRILEMKQARGILAGRG